MDVFLLDGNKYDVHVVALHRTFSVLDTDQSGRTQDGEMYREPIGTFYNYTMTVRARTGKTEELDAFWEAISQPTASHVCVFPYNQTTLTQRMYVTGGEQNMQYLTADAAHWGDLTVNFIAMRPKVVA